MIYGVTLGGKHTYRDWGLLPKTRPTIAPPKVRTNYVDVPGLDGALDLSEALTGRVGYQTRDFSAEFIVIDARNRWDALYSEILDTLHGQRVNIILDQDPGYFYRARDRERDGERPQDRHHQPESRLRPVQAGNHGFAG